MFVPNIIDIFTFFIKTDMIGKLRPQGNLRRKGVNVMDDQNNPTVGTPDPNAGGMPPQDPGMGGGVPAQDPAVGGVTPPPAENPGAGEVPAADPNQGWTPPPAPSTPPADPNAGVPAQDPAQGGGDTGTPGGTV